MEKLLNILFRQLFILYNEHSPELPIHKLLTDEGAINLQVTLDCAEFHRIATFLTNAWHFECPYPEVDSLERGRMGRISCHAHL